jgi:DNA topoisomerase-3
MSVLVIAEKPSVGKSIAAVLGANEQQNGYMQSSGYIVSWCIGHLVSLADASAYGDFGKWRQEDLPILPNPWQTVVDKDKQKQFDILRELMNRADTESLICATDAGREGELIFRFVYTQAGCKKPFKRLWISSMEESAIRTGFGNLKDGSEYDNLYASALMRAKADWIVGINATRLFSTLYGKTLSVGRVQSPTLAILVSRQEKISSFIKEKYHHVELVCGDIVAVSERISDASAAGEVQAAADGKTAICISVTAGQKSVAPPKLFDLTALQREANKLFGYTAKQSLDIAQALYEKKLITYPRTDSRYLTQYMEVNLTTLADTATVLLCMDDVSSVNTAQVIDDAKVSDHHAIVPTLSVDSAEMAAHTDTERNILLLVAARLLCAVSGKHIYEAMAATFECGGHSFTAKGKTVLTDGWKAVEALFKNMLKLKTESDGADDGGDTKALLPVREGQSFENTSASVTEHFISPPKPYTEAALLSAMEAAGASDTTDEAERKGLGTPATRATVIENLINRGFVERKGKQLLPTADGRTLIKVLPDIIKSPELTAEWENTLTLIAKGEASSEGFISGIEEMTKSIVQSSTKDESLACMFSPGKAAIGKCPRCGSDVFEGKKNFYCKNRDCAFVMWKNDRFFTDKKKELTATIAAALLSDGKANVTGLYSERMDKTYGAVVLLADTGEKYVNYRLGKRE